MQKTKQEKQHRLFLDYSLKKTEIALLHHHTEVDSCIDELLLCLFQYHELPVNEHMEFK